MGVRGRWGVSALSWCRQRGLDGYAPHVDLRTEVDRRPAISRLALVTAVVQWLGVLSLIILFAVGGGPFGFINDVANGLVGLLSLALAWLWVSGLKNAVEHAGHRCCHPRSADHDGRIDLDHL